MGCIRVDKITEYLCEPLRKCLKDEDPYVRKTAAVCVAKLHDINAQLVEDQGFLDTLKDLISDSNPMVGLVQAALLCYYYMLLYVSYHEWQNAYKPQLCHLLMSHCCHTDVECNASCLSFACCHICWAWFFCVCIYLCSIFICRL